MPSPLSRVDRLVKRLEVAGFAPRVMRHRDRLRIETELPGEVSAASWRELLAALATADRFGLVQGADRSRTAWADIHRDAPTAPDTPRGHGQRP